MDGDPTAMIQSRDCKDSKRKASGGFSPGGTLKDSRLLWLKGGLFLFLGCLGGGVLLIRTQDWVTSGLFVLSVWAFCRAYYFAFYVIQHYVDPRYRFAGLTDFVRYAVFGGSPDENSFGQSECKPGVGECAEAGAEDPGD